MGGGKILMKSIMQEEKECYLCRKLYDAENVQNLQEHHCIHGTANRTLSELYGLKVFLCIYHHTQGIGAVHRNRDYDLLLIREAQIKFEERYGHAEFMRVFRKNYL